MADFIYETPAEAEARYDELKAKSAADTTPNEADEYRQLATELHGESFSNDQRVTYSGTVSTTGGATPKGGMDLPPGEARLAPTDSLAAYARRHNIGGVNTGPQDFDYNAFWGARMGFCKANAETRVVGLGEDTTSGAGAANAVIATVWAHEVQDLIRADCFLFEAGATTFPMPSEIYNLPLFSADIAPSYVAEAASVSLDTTPSLGTLQFNASGAFVDITAASLNALEDAYNNGGLSALIQNSIAQKYARLIESVALYGQSGSAGNPGIVNESGLLVYSAGTNGAAPINYAALSSGAALVRAQSVSPNAIVMHPSMWSAYAQLTDSTGQPMRPTPDIADLPILTSGLLDGFTETQGSSNITTSAFVGDWSYVHVGMRLDGGVQTMVLKERYADQQQMAWMSRLRFSVRTVHPNQAMCQVKGLLV
jgi:HK97 family phage major capsid protein